MDNEQRIIITYHGDVETTSFFMSQIEKQLKKDGYHICPFYFDINTKKVVDELHAQNTTEDVQNAEQCLKIQLESSTAPKVYFLTFNFAGLYGEDAWLDEDGVPIVDKYKMNCVNIIVDHPYHYHSFMQDQLLKRPDRYMQICIDQVHIEYMKKYFPQIQMGPFMPSGGTGILDLGDDEKNTWENLPAFAERSMDVVFVGTYVQPEYFNVFIDRNGKEYSDFYHTMIDEAYEYPERRLEDIVRRRLLEEIEEEVSEAEIRETLGHIQFLDYYIRFKRRGEIVRYLVDQGVQIHIFGSGWESLKEQCEKTENMILHPYITSKECLTVLADAKISLNVLPCFHAGAHDRIFNSMLCGAVCVTDSNAYLDEILKDGENAVVYKVGASYNQLLVKINQMLNYEIEWIKISERGYMCACNHKWGKRAELIEQIKWSIYQY